MILLGIIVMSISAFFSVDQFMKGNMIWGWIFVSIFCLSPFIYLGKIRENIQRRGPQEIGPPFGANGWGKPYLEPDWVYPDKKDIKDND